VDVADLQASRIAYMESVAEVIVGRACDIDSTVLIM